MATRETREEASAVVRPRRVIAVLDKAAQGYRNFPFSLYTLFVEADLVSLDDFTPNNEILERGFFSADSIPELSAEKITPKQVALCFTAHLSKTFECVFD
jgi:ADP-ribose pyrophosphatase YjhB (NUDIX family)